MKRIHAALVSLLLGIAAIVGVVALERTVALGPSTPSASSAISIRHARLDQVAAQIDALRRSGPPTTTARPKPAAPPEQVIYVRAPSVAQANAAERELEHELELEGESEGGFDD